MKDENGNFYKPERGSTASPDHIMLAICGDAKSEMGVMWRTDAKTDAGYVLYHEVGSDNVMRADAVSEIKETDIDISRYNWAKLKGLKSGTKYSYSVGSDADRSEEFTFETEPESLDKFSFIIIGDHQKGDPCHLPDYSCVNRMLKTALNRHPECRFLFTAGDNCDNGQNDLQWNGMFEGLKGIIESMPYMMTTGNHDNRGYITYFPEPTGKFYLEHADFFDYQFGGVYPDNGPEGYTGENYSFDYGNAHFLVLGINAPDKVAPWAYEDLQKSDKTWKLGAYHFPIYPIMPEGQNNDAYPWLRKPIEEGRLDILFAGHEHSFARTYPLKNDEMFDKPSQGTINYITCNGGGNIYHSNARKIWHSAFYPQEERMGAYTLVEIDGNVLTATTIMEDGRIVDLMTIDKDKDQILPHALAPTYDWTKMAFKGDMLELIAREHYAQNIDGVWYAPFGIVIQYIGGKVIKEKDTLYCEAYDHHALFTDGSNKAMTDLGTVEMNGKAYFHRNQLYVPIEESAKIFEMEWYHAKRNNFINWNTPSEDKPLCKHPE